MQRRHPAGPKRDWLGYATANRLRADFLGFASNLQEQYGDVARLQVGPFSVYQFTHPDQIHELLVHRAGDFRKSRRVARIFRPWIGTGMLLNDGPSFARRRRVVQAAMQKHDAQQQVESAIRHTRRLVLSKTGEAINLAEALERVAFSVVVDTVLGVDAVDDLDALFETATVLQLDGIQKMSTMSPLGRLPPTRANRKFRAALAHFRATFRSVVARRRADNDGRGLLGQMLLGQGEAAGLTEQEVCDETSSLVFGGKETAGVSITWTCFLLAQHPTIQDSTAAEVDEVLAGQPPCLESAARLPRVTQAFNEGMRLYPPVSVIAREAAQNTEVGGYPIAKRSQVYVPVYVVHRDARWFAEPGEFRPERFSTEAEPPRQHAYMPFGAGPHQCIGRRMATLEASVVLSTLLQHCRLRLPEDAAPIELVSDMTLHPRDGLQMRLEPRRATATVASEA
jgi:cytochrome P450